MIKESAKDEKLKSKWNERGPVWLPYGDERDEFDLPEITDPGDEYLKPEPEPAEF